METSTKIFLVAYLVIGLAWMTVPIKESRQLLKPVLTNWVRETIFWLAAAVMVAWWPVLVWKTFLRWFND